jgi:membrane protease subunit (stomatin/prohibitin family)
MGWTREQFLDVIEYIDESDRILVHKYNGQTRNEIKQGAKVIIREGQCGVFVKGGKLADIWTPGTYRLDTENLPVLSSVMALPYLFNSPIKSDFYFVSTKQSTDNKWGTKNPIMMRDADFGVIRLRAFGLFSFRIVDVEAFMKEIFGSQKKVMTWDIVEYLSSYIPTSFAETISELNIPALDLSSAYTTICETIKLKVNVRCKNLGIEFTNINLENISLPDEVEKLIDEQSGMGLASKDMATYAQYQSLRAMRDASQQEGGLVGLGAGMALGNQMVSNINQTQQVEIKDAITEIKRYKELLDEGIITQEEFDAKKKSLLNI